MAVHWNVMFVSYLLLWKRKPWWMVLEYNTMKCTFCIYIYNKNLILKLNNAAHKPRDTGLCLVDDWTDHHTSSFHCQSLVAAWLETCRDLCMQQAKWLWILVFVHIYASIVYSTVTVLVYAAYKTMLLLGSGAVCMHSGYLL